MDFEFNENQLDLQKMVRELAEKEIGPRAKENDEKDVFPVDVFKMLADMGLTAIRRSRIIRRTRSNRHRKNDSY